jgi:hypothetical protein
LVLVGLGSFICGVALGYPAPAGSADAG